MVHFRAAFLILLAAGTVLTVHAQLPRKLGAPTFYIASRAEYGDDSSKMHVTGASNLPPGARLQVEVVDGDSVLNTEAFATVSQNGFFETVLTPRAGKAFRHNVVCDITFTPGLSGQPASVLRIVGRDGAHLGFLENPQTYIHSGTYYLEESIYVR